MYVTDVGADRKQLWHPIWSSDCKFGTALRLELCSIPTSITMPGNNGQHGAPIFKPLVGLARIADRGEPLLWAGFPGYDAGAVLPLGQARPGQARDPICVEAESSKDVTASATFLMHHTQTHRYATEGWFFVGNNAFVHPLPMEDVMPLFFLKTLCRGVKQAARWIIGILQHWPKGTGEAVYYWQQFCAISIQNFASIVLMTRMMTTVIFLRSWWDEPCYFRNTLLSLYRKLCVCVISSSIWSDPNPSPQQLGSHVLFCVYIQFLVLGGSKWVLPSWF